MSGATPHPGPVDPDLPGFDTLMAEGVPEPVSALFAEVGSRIEEIARIQVTWRPGKQLLTRYRITASEGPLAGQQDLVAVVGRIPDGSALVEGPDAVVGLWIVPEDPQLPGLRSALDLPTLSRLLTDLGASDEPEFARLRAYRPGRRAVVEVGAGGSSIYLKVVPPSSVDSLHRKHRHLSDHLPVPDSLGLAPNLGIVVMRSLPGTDLRTVLREGRAIPDPLILPALVVSLPNPEPEWTTHSPLATVPGLVDLLQRILPDETVRLTNLRSGIGTDGDDDLVPVHGDFHEAQIIVQDGQISGLIDVDTYGWGRSADDAATMLAHLHLLAPGTRSPEMVLDLARTLQRHWDGHLDPVDLRKRTAAVVLGLATGPFRVQRPNWPAETMARIATAEEWVASAHRVDEKSLMPNSERSYPAGR